MGSYYIYDFDLARKKCTIETIKVSALVERAYENYKKTNEPIIPLKV